MIRTNHEIFVVEIFVKDEVARSGGPPQDKAERVDIA